MATQPDTFDAIADATAPLDEPITLADILAADNICDLLTDTERNEIGSRCLRGFEIDQASRADWLEEYKLSLAIAMQVSKPKTFPWKNAANIHFPLLITAATQFQARAAPIILSGTEMARGRVLGPDPVGRKAARAARIGLHMSWQLGEDMPGWEDDTDRMLLMLPIVGPVFRKCYFDEVRRTNMAVSVPAENFVVNYWAKSLASTPRYTHIMPMYPYEVRESIAAGIWREIELVPGNAERKDQPDDEEGLGEMLEQHCLLDLDKDGYPEPYIVTMNRQGDVACIRACFDESGVTVNERGGIARIERHVYFVKYGFLPAPDGSFYDMGFGRLLRDITKSIDTTINQLLDAGTLQNTGMGFIGSGINIRGGKMEIGPGRLNRVDVTGGLLRDNLVMMDLPGPSPVLFNLLGMMVDAAKGITSVQDVLTGADVPANQPATTTLARIEQGMKVMTGIIKRIHRTFGEELKILFRLNGAHLDDQVYANLNDTPIEIGRADYQQGDMDVVPVSDPTMASDMQKLARAELLMSRRGDPQFNQEEIARRFLEAANITDPEKLLTGKEPPDPKVLLEIEKQGDEHLRTMADVRLKHAQTAQAMASALADLKNAGLLMDAADVAGPIVAIADKLMEEIEGGQGGPAEQADGQGGAGPMAGGPADGGVPGLPGEAPGEPGGGMVPGVGPVGGGPGGGGAMQPPAGLFGG